MSNSPVSAVLDFRLDDADDEEISPRVTVLPLSDERVCRVLVGDPMFVLLEAMPEYPAFDLGSNCSLACDDEDDGAAIADDDDEDDGSVGTASPDPLSDC